MQPRRWTSNKAATSKNTLIAPLTLYAPPPHLHYLLSFTLFLRVSHTSDSNGTLMATLPIVLIVNGRTGLCQCTVAALESKLDLQCVSQYGSTLYADPSLRYYLHKQAINFCVAFVKRATNFCVVSVFVCTLEASSQRLCPTTLIGREIGSDRQMDRKAVPFLSVCIWLNELQKRKKNIS